LQKLRNRRTIFITVERVTNKTKERKYETDIEVSGEEG
jgi:hypothetical protein